MSPRVTAVCCAAVVVAVSATVAGAQADATREWNSPPSLELARRAAERRSVQLADTGLTDYRALARGYVTFLGQLGEGFPDPPQVVRADELAVEVYWRAPNRSKQLVIGRRAELVRPTDIAYHTDHLAIVQNNFPAIIRLGDGDEVRDVPHPLSAAGQEAYDFAVADSLSLRVGDREWDVIAVEFRPRDDRLPRAIGTAYIDRETASVVRLSVAFTRAALIDPALEDVSVVLDNGLVDGRFWLPRRQEIEIRRSGTWFEFPARGIIRGEWDLCCVEANRGVPAELFVGPEVTFASPSVLAAYPFAGRLKDSIAARASAAGPERPATQVQERAAELVRAEALARGSRARVSARAVSEFVRVNRVEGLAIGAGGVVPFTPRLVVRANARFGLDDALFKYSGSLDWSVTRRSRLSVSLFDEFRAAGDVPEASTLGNSIASQEFGADASNDYRVTGVSFAVQGGDRVRWRAGIEQVREAPLAVHATPFSGRYHPAFDADRLSGTGIRVDISGRSTHTPVGMAVDWRVAMAAGQRSTDAALTSPAARFTRFAAELRGTRSLGPGTIDLWALGAAASAGAPSQAQVLLGGPVTGPGYPVHSLRGRYGSAARVEWRVPVGSFPLNLGRFGATRVGVTAAPFLSAMLTDQSTPGRTGDWHRTVGMGVITLYEGLRIDVVRGVDTGGVWSVRADFGRMLWPIL